MGAESKDPKKEELIAVAAGEEQLSREAFSEAVRLGAAKCCIIGNEPISLSIGKG